MKTSKHFLIALFTLFATAKSFSQDVMLETLGSLSATSVYNTYMAIGAVLDGYDAYAYDSTFVVDIMNEQVLMANNMMDQLNKLSASGELTDQSDREYVQSLIKLYGGLSRQAELLRDYVNNPDDTGEAFQEQREINWAEIKEMLGIEE